MNSGFINSLVVISEDVSAAKDRVERGIRREGKVEKRKGGRREKLLSTFALHYIVNCRDI